MGRYGATRCATDDRFVAVLDADMHLGAADQLLAGQQLVVGEHLSVAGCLGHLHFGRHRQRHGPGGDHAHAQLGGGVDQDPAVPGSSSRSPSSESTTALFVSTTQRCSSAT